LGPHTGINPHSLKANHIWQTGVTHIPQFGTLKYFHVTVDTYSGVLFASVHTVETTKHALGHAFANFGIPKSIKMDNGPTYTSKNNSRILQIMGHYSQYWNSLQSSRPSHCRTTTSKDQKTTY
jgi:transposase InsO family protein